MILPVFGGFLLIFLLILMSFVLAPSLGDFDDDGFPELEGGPIRWLTRHLFFGSLSLGFTLGVFAAILRLEYLTGHIGEKRPADRTTKLIKALIQARFATTALFDSAVVLILFIQRKIFNFGRCFIMRKFVPSSLFDENFLVQGGL
jgi:hypothetical protein